jgi:hypothetical protein
MKRRHCAEKLCAISIPNETERVIVEHLWSQAGATSGNRWQMREARKRLKQANSQPLATHGNGPRPHGKEGVNGSSPLEGSKKALQSRAFLFQINCS